MKGRNLLAPLLSSVSLAWCLLAGSWLWFAPMRYSGIRDGVQAVQYRSFAEVSRFGPVPLIVPISIAAFAAWSAWRGHRIALGFAALLLAAFTVISGFSIGGAYLPAAGLLLVAAGLAAALGSGRSKSTVA
jgi:hypothetical protein